MKRRPGPYRALLAVGSVVAALAAAELGLRAYEAFRQPRTGEFREQLERSRQAPLESNEAVGSFGLRGLVRPGPGPELPFELKPRLSGRFKGGHISINSWGFRGPELELDKPRDTLRIVGLGDSFMFGWGVDDEETYLAVLEAALNATGGARFQVLNLAVPGYNTAMEVATLAHKGLAFEPDLVVVHFYRNDLNLPFFMRPPAAERGLRLAALVERALGGPGARGGGQQALVEHDRVRRNPEGLGEVEGAYRHMVGEAGFRRAMARLAELTSARSIPVAVILFEDDSGLAALVRGEAVARGFQLVEPRQRFLAHLADNGQEPEQWEKAFHLSGRDVHFNALGHSLIAAELVECLAPHFGREAGSG